MKNCDNKWNLRQNTVCSVTNFIHPLKMLHHPRWCGWWHFASLRWSSFSSCRRLWPSTKAFLTDRAKKGFFCSLFYHLGYNFVFSSNHSNLNIYDFVSSAKGIFKLRIGFLKGGNSQLLQLLQEMQQWYNATFLDRFNFF